RRTDAQEARARRTDALHPGLRFGRRAVGHAACEAGLGHVARPGGIRRTGVAARRCTRAGAWCSGDGLALRLISSVYPEPAREGPASKGVLRLRFATLRTNGAHLLCAIMRR